MTRRDVWRIPRAGNASRLRRESERVAPTPAGHIRVAVHAVGLNFADIFALAGLYSATPRGPFVPGLEFAGQVLESNATGSALRPGQSVMGMTRFGGYATIVDSEPAHLVPLPDGWDFAEGAAWPVQTLTAWYALTRLGAVRAGHRVLVHSAAGGVGLQAMQLARALSAVPVGTVGRAAKAVWLRERGFEDVLVREPDFAAQLARTQRRFDLVLDGIGGDVQRASFDALDPMGRLVVFGAAEFTPRGSRPDYLRAAWRYLRRPRYDVMDMISSNRSVLAFNLIWLWQQQDELTALLGELEAIPLPAPHVGRRFAFDDALAALAHLRSGESIGKVVLEVDANAMPTRRA